MRAIHTVRHPEAATWEGQRRRRPKALQLGRLLIPETRRGGGPAPSGWGRAQLAGAGQTAGREAQVSPPLPFPSAEPSSATTQEPLHHKDRSFSRPVRLKFIGLSQRSGPPGFVVRRSGPSRQGRKPVEPLNYNPHNAP